MKVIGKNDLSSWKASYLAQRFDISVDEARTLKEGGIIDVSRETGNKIVGDGFGIPAPSESEE